MSNRGESKPSGTGGQIAKATVFYVQPLIARYRMEVVSSLSETFNVKVFANTRDVELLGFSSERPACNEFIETPISKIFKNRISVQAKVLGRIIRERPAAVLMFADVNYLSLWLALLAGRLLGVPIVIHGQGLYRYQKPGLARSLCYRAAIALSAKYVCYAEASKRSLEKIGCQTLKLTTAANSLSIGKTIDPEMKAGTESGILFIGRLRDGSNIECLIEAIETVRNDGHAVTLHVIGGGEHLGRLRQTYADRPHIVWHGAIFDDGDIAKVSMQCRIGCYPGAAGLSVVHMFGLSLPPLVHDQLAMHMGPEPEYVEHLETGFLYSKDGGGGALSTALIQIWRMPPEALYEIAKRAFARYQHLNAPPLGRRLAHIVNQVIAQ
ncbi:MULTISPECIES: glycosyltransferase [unclassified Burkholderia]|uniref:glycosyltransferase n=1 Tax=unclassified Burkholderia TaxID=2613784 RepID=UPI000F598063|nr:MULTISPECIES: glycosyltransferase [unclassified Burkholderia]RQS20533.1 glycosyltransferase family 1 protein [Burkholderia sp. Bp8995]RQS40366.1 glycosyltransferase family 1 protein [Burkholderia sp. Bp8989]